MKKRVRRSHLLPSGKLVESILPFIHSDELLASNTVVAEFVIEDSDKHEGSDHHESYDFNCCD